MITCDKAKELLSEYLENQLAPDLKQTMDEHLTECLHCKNLVVNMTFLRQRLHSIRPVSTSSQFDQQLRQRITGSIHSGQKALHIPVQKISYGFSGLAILAALYFFIFTDGTSTSKPVPTINPPAASNPVNPSSPALERNASMATEQSGANPTRKDTLNPQQGKIDQEHIKLIER